MLLLRIPPDPLPAPLSVRAFVFDIVVPLRSKAPPLETVTVELLAPRAVALPTFNVPVEIVVPAV